WTVAGVAGGDATHGTITSRGLYTAPAIDPGGPVAVSIAQAAALAPASALITVVNPELAPFQGASWQSTLAGWNERLQPWVENLSGLAWDPAARAWSPVAGWSTPAEGIAPNIYYLEEALRPLTRMAVVRQDAELMEELALFHTALLSQRTTTIGAMLAHTANPVIFIDGAPTERTFAWYEPYSATQVRVRDCQTCNAQYLSTAARLLRAIAELPAASRTAPMLDFVRRYSGFLVEEQLLRLMYGTTPWSHWNNPHIPQPAAAAWAWLAATGYRPPRPYRYEAAMTDMELWMVASSAEVLAADKAAPELRILSGDEAARLRQAVTAGVALAQARCHHETAPDGADVLSAFAGDYDDHPDYAYASDTDAAQPTAPAPRAGASWDISHAYRFPIIFRTLYETRGATGVSFPSRADLVALANSYVHLAYDGNPKQPAFSNFLDGWNGWFAVDPGSSFDGYPPYQFCRADTETDNCLIPGTLQGWGELAPFNPELAALSQSLIDLAWDDSADVLAFKDQHYFYAGQHYSAIDGAHPLLMVYVAGDSAERLR
ncbi:MAG: hypothetical protein WCE75_09920, partial [Terracidiphilus sp.]